MEHNKDIVIIGEFFNFNSVVGKVVYPLILVGTFKIFLMIYTKTHSVNVTRNGVNFTEINFVYVS